MAGRAQPAWPTPHLCLFGNFRFKEQGRASSPIPIPAPGDEAENSPEGSRSSATQKTQRQGKCRSGRSCSRCRVCLSFQGPETEADEEAEEGFMLISLTQAGSALPSSEGEVSQCRTVPRHCSDPPKLEAPQVSLSTCREASPFPTTEGCSAPKTSCSYWNPDLPE